MNFSYTPFGQATFILEKPCGTMDTSSYVWGEFWDGYDANKRLCFNTACGADHASLYGDRPAGCFSRKAGPYCQHGGAECAVNAIQACARKLSHDDWTVYAPFAVCFEEHYEEIQVPPNATENSTFAENKTLAEVSINATAVACAGDNNTGLSAEDVLKCYHSSEFEVLSEMAAATVPHVTIPFVRIMQCNGQWQILTLGDSTKLPQSLLVDAVCKAACPGSDAAAACGKLPGRMEQLPINI